MPHHDRDWRSDRRWRHFEAMARRGFRGMGGLGGFGANWGGFGDSFRIGRMLASGDLRLVALYFIELQPRHGYDLIKAIEDKTAGFYSPSPGIVYPALTFLEEAGYATSAAEGNRKLYTITDEGRAHLAENSEAVHATLDFLGQAGERMRHWRDMSRRGEGPFSGERGPGRGSREPFARHHEPGEHRHEHGSDRDIVGVIEPLNRARRDLKAAIAEALGGADDTEQRRIADILARAADEIGRRSVDL